MYNMGVFTFLWFQTFSFSLLDPGSSSSLFWFLIISWCYLLLLLIGAVTIPWRPIHLVCCPSFTLSLRSLKKYCILFLTGPSWITFPRLTSFLYQFPTLYSKILTWLKMEVWICSFLVRGSWMTMSIISFILSTTSSSGKWHSPSSIVFKNVYVDYKKLFPTLLSTVASNVSFRFQK